MKVAANTDILIWARKEMNLTQEVVAKRMNQDVKTIKLWESGKDYPTYVQLENLAYKIYKKPLAIFFFPNIPQNIKKQEKNFRTLNNEVYKELPPRIIELMNKARALQINLKELEIESQTKFTSIKFDTTNMDETCKKLRRILGIDIKTQKMKKTDNIAFEMWRDAFYKCGIYVFKDAFKEDAFSGFCLYDDDYPVIYINNSMSFNRQTFTLFHEIYHIILRTSGIDKIKDDFLEKLSTKNKYTETLCNSFAGNFLVPSSELEIEVKNREIKDENVKKYAEEYNVSREVIYRKLYEMHKISKAKYEKMHKELNKESYRSKKNSSGGDYYNTQKKYLGERYIYDVFESYNKGKISINDVSDFLNMKIENIPELSAKIEGRI